MTERKSQSSVLEQTAAQVSAFTRNMQFGRLDAGLMNLQHINQILDNNNGQAEDALST